MHDAPEDDFKRGTGMSMTTNPIQETPLLSIRTLRIIIVTVVLFVLLLIAINVIGRWLGGTIALAGHTTSTDTFDITIGPDRLALAANTIRLPQARTHGATDRIDLYLAWPEMAGYSPETSHRFNDLSRPGQLIFIQLGQSTMSRDMSGRLEPIYKDLFEGEEKPLEGGLTLHHLRRDSGYAGEVMITGKRDGQPDYAVRCILPEDQHSATNADCQRDIFAGRDMTVLYRFSSTLLPEWRAVDAAVRAYIEARLIRAESPAQDR